MWTGKHIEVKGGNAKSKIEQSLEYLVSHVYSELSLIEKNADTDADIIEILNGADNMMPGMEPNRGAATKIEEYLENAGNEKSSNLYGRYPKPL